MDYRLNNEALTACVIVQVVRNGWADLTEAVGMTNLLMQPSLRKKAMKSDEEGELCRLFGQIDGGMLTVIMNSIVMLEEGGCVERDGHNLKLTPQGVALCQSMSNGRSKVLSGIVESIPTTLGIYAAIDKQKLYNQLHIAE